MSVEMKLEGGCYCGSVRFCFALPSCHVELLDCLDHLATAQFEEVISAEVRVVAR